MKKNFYFFLFFFVFIINNLYSEENIMILKLKNGEVKIELFPDVAPNHVKRFKTLASMPKSRPPSRASPLIFNKIRLKRGVLMVFG